MFVITVTDQDDIMFPVKETKKAHVGVMFRALNTVDTNIMHYI